MFNQEQYAILRRCSEQKSIAEWNNYRAEHPKTEINLQNADLKRASLEGVKLNEANLEGARFEGADLFAADLRKADLRRANLERAKLWGATLSGANLEDASLVSANLENADLRGALLERVDLRGANLQDAIIPEGLEQSRSGPKDEVEAIINLVDDITYREFISLIKCLERLSVILGGSLPHINRIQITRPIEVRPTSSGTEMQNMISVDIPRSVADNLHGLLPVGVTADQDRIDITLEETETGDALQTVLANAGFSEDAQRAVMTNPMLPQMEKDKLMEDLGIVANLVECGRIYF
ncbi:MAG: pentapeptide repeat-containing protein [Sedimentisphaerales bacterium]|jgi:hypothetical protein